MPEKEKNCLNDNSDSPYGIRTRVTAVKRRCLNPLTNGPEVLEKFSLTLLLLYQIDFICLHFFKKSMCLNFRESPTNPYNLRKL